MAIKDSLENLVDNVKKAHIKGKMSAQEALYSRIRDERDAGISDHAIYARQPYLFTEFKGYFSGFFKQFIDYYRKN